MVDTRVSKWLDTDGKKFVEVTSPDHILFKGFSSMVLYLHLTPQLFRSPAAATGWLFTEKKEPWL